MADDYERRIATIEAICTTTLPRIEQFMAEGHRLRAENSGNISSILTKVTSFDAYQKKCDDERMKMTENISGHDDRITAVEGFQGRLIKASVAAGGFIAFLSYGGGKIIDKLDKLFFS